MIEAKRMDHGFALLLKSGEEVYCGALLLATGFTDSMPTIAGVQELHGEFVVPCPYCDGYEVRDQPIAAFSSPDEIGARFAFLLGQWSKDVEPAERDVDGLRLAVLVDDLHPDAVAGLVGGQRGGEVVDAPDGRAVDRLDDVARLGCRPSPRARSSGRRRRARRPGSASRDARTNDFGM